MIRPRSITKYQPASYPTRPAVLAEPELLEKHQPAGWQKNPELQAVAALLLAANTMLGCKSSSLKNIVAEPKTAVVAPIFEHGAGRGVTGCVVVNPAIFLHEEEALLVIQDELRKAEVYLSEQAVEVETIRFPFRRQHYDRETGEMRVIEDLDHNPPFTLDGVDPEHQVAIEYVTRMDYYHLGGTMELSTVNRWDTKALTEGMAKQLRDKGPSLYFGVFYDPMTKMVWDSGRSDDPHESYRQAARIGQIESKRLLRQQVRDFIDWLKGQGVI